MLNFTHPTSILGLLRDLQVSYENIRQLLKLLVTAIHIRSISCCSYDSGFKECRKSPARKLEFEMSRSIGVVVQTNLETLYAA